MRQLKLRVERRVIDQLAELVDSTGGTNSACVASLIESEHARRIRRQRKPAK